MTIPEPLLRIYGERYEGKIKNIFVESVACSVERAEGNLDFGFWNERQTIKNRRER
jgi:hypothetical protein